MNEQEKHALLWLTHAQVSVKALAKMLDVYPSADAILADVHGAVSKLVPSRMYQRMLEMLDKTDELQNQLWHCGAKTVFYSEDAYPVLLSQVEDAPMCLFVRGNENAMQGKLLGMVGTRNPSDKGGKWTYDTAKELTAAGLSIVSGLARGIDTCAHRGCVDTGGKTIAVMGTGPDMVYPEENTALAEKVIDSGGCLITEYFPGDIPDRTRFPRRNRIIAGMTKGTVMVEGQKKSGGMITMDYCKKYGRLRMAVPGMVGAYRAEGPHAVIRDGGRLVTCASDILEDTGWQEGQLSFLGLTQNTSAPTADPVESTLLALLDGENKTLDELIARSGKAAEDVQTAIVMLELSGRVAKRPGGFYEKIT